MAVCLNSDHPSVFAVFGGLKSFRGWVLLRWCRVSVPTHGKKQDHGRKKKAGPPSTSLSTSHLKRKLSLVAPALRFLGLLLLDGFSAWVSVLSPTSELLFAERADSSAGSFSLLHFAEGRLPDFRFLTPN